MLNGDNLSWELCDTVVLQIKHFQGAWQLNVELVQLVLGEIGLSKLIEVSELDVDFLERVV